MATQKTLTNTLVFEITGTNLFSKTKKIRVFWKQIWERASMGFKANFFLKLWNNNYLH